MERKDGKETERKETRNNGPLKWPTFGVAAVNVTPVLNRGQLNPRIDECIPSSCLATDEMTSSEVTSDCVQKD